MADTAAPAPAADINKKAVWKCTKEEEKLIAQVFIDLSQTTEAPWQARHGAVKTTWEKAAAHLREKHKQKWTNGGSLQNKWKDMKKKLKELEDEDKGSGKELESPSAAFAPESWGAIVSEAKALEQSWVETKEADRIQIMAKADAERDLAMKRRAEALGDHDDPDGEDDGRDSDGGADIDHEAVEKLCGALSPPSPDALDKIFDGTGGGSASGAGGAGGASGAGSGTGSKTSSTSRRTGGISAGPVAHSGSKFSEIGAVMDGLKTSLDSSLQAVMTAMGDQQKALIESEERKHKLEQDNKRRKIGVAEMQLRLQYHTAGIPFPLDMQLVTSDVDVAAPAAPHAPAPAPAGAHLP